ncbi:MAG: peptide chain release factor 2 [Caldilineales bacterium]|nr:peptide chain release factor 2 [Caldilineales bacterium]
MSETKTLLESLEMRLQTIRGVFDWPGKLAELDKLEKTAADPDIWSDPKAAQTTMRRLSTLREQINSWEQLSRQVTDALELLELAEMEEDEETLEAVAAEAQELEAAIDQRELSLALSGEMDDSDAILAIHAGEGGTEAQDWVEMMLRMYLRWAERHDYKTTIADTTPGEEAGIKSVTVEIEGPWAYGYLKGEKGNHRLVRISPFDASNRRHTSFAQVEVLPLLDDDIEIDIHPNDIKMDVFLSGGAGGQNVQKNATAVRLTHIPTGIVVTCQNERSQTQNRETAMRVLRSRLYEIELARKEEQEAEYRGGYVKAGFGTRIRNYVLHPYQMVKDERTSYETGNTGAVLDGDLDDFIDAWLKLQVGGRESSP